MKEAVPKGWRHREKLWEYQRGLENKGNSESKALRKHTQEMPTDSTGINLNASSRFSLLTRVSLQAYLKAGVVSQPEADG